MVRGSDNERQDVSCDKEKHAPVKTVCDEEKSGDQGKHKALLLDEAYGEQEVCACTCRQERMQRTLYMFLSLTALLADEHYPTDGWLSLTDEMYGMPPVLTIEERLVTILQQILHCRGVLLAEWTPDTDRLHTLGASGVLIEDNPCLDARQDGICLHTFLQDAAMIHRLQAGKILSLSSSPYLPAQQHIVLPLLYQHKFSGFLLIAYSHTGHMLADGGHVILQSMMRLGTLVMQLRRDQREKERLQDDVRSANELVARVQAQKQRIMMTIRHDVRMTLLGMRNCSEIIYERPMSGSTVQEFAADIHADASRLLYMIRDMVDLELLEQAHLDLQWEWLNINTLIVDVVNQRRSVTMQHAIHVHMARALPLIAGDRAKLMQVLAILLDIALSGSEAGGDITVSSWIESRLLHVRILPPGRMIFPTLPHLLDPDNVDLDVPCYGGDADNLAVARESIQAHGGQLWIDDPAGDHAAWHFTLRFSKALSEPK